MLYNMSVLLPALNEAATIESVISEVVTEGIHPNHILVGDNGSSDETAQIADHKGATVFSILARGKGNVIRELVKHIETPLALVVDSDCTYQIKGNIQQMHRLLDSYDAVLTYRVPTDGAMTTLHWVGNTALSLLVSVLYWTWIRDVVSGMWGFRTEMLNHISIGTGGFTPDVDFVTGVLNTKFRITQTPVQYSPRPDGSKPKLNALHGAVIAARIIRRRCEHWLE